MQRFHDKVTMIGTFLHNYVFRAQRVNKHDHIFDFLMFLSNINNKVVCFTSPRSPVATNYSFVQFVSRLPFIGFNHFCNYESAIQH